MSSSIEFKFDLEGWKELDKALSSMSSGISKSLMHQAMTRAAKPIVRDAQDRCAMSSWDSGLVADTIKAIAAKGTRYPTVVIGPDSAHWYGVLFEIGFRSRPAEPFLRPAWDAGKRAAADNLLKDVWYVLDRQATRLVKQAYAGKLSARGRKALGL